MTDRLSAPPGFFVALALVTGCDHAAAAAALASTGRDVKRAALVVQGLDPDLAGTLRDRHHGSLRAAMAAMAAEAAQ